MKLKRMDRAAKLYDRARIIKETSFGPNHVSIAVVLNNLAAAKHAQGENKKALSLYGRAIKIREKTYGKDTIANSSTLDNIALVYESEKDYKNAIKYYKKELDLVQKHNEDINTITTILNSIAHAHLSMENYEKAVEVIFFFNFFF